MKAAPSEGAGAPLAGRLVIRPLHASDSMEQLTDLIHAAYAPHAANGLRFWGTHQSAEDTTTRFQSGHGLVALVDGVLIGTVVARPPKPDSAALLYRDAETWSFGQLAVAPEFKGRGVGKALHDAAVDVARRHGAQVMALDTAAPANGLIAMYESWGYRIVGSADWRPDTNYLSVLMACRIEELGLATPHT